MKAIFLTEGGKKLGLGHLVRCVSLQEAFEEKGIASEFIVNADHGVDGILKDVNHRRCDWLNPKEDILSLINKTDVVIIDSYFADLDFCHNVSQIAQKVVYLDDHNRINYPQGIVVNSAIYAQEVNYPKSNGNSYLLGTQYACLRKEFWDIPQKENRESLQKILITLGGMDYSGLMERIVGHLKDKFHCIFHCIDFYKTKISPQSFLQSILESDLCISGGGQTIYNLARCGLPTIGICLSENQLLNLQWWGRTKFLEFAGGYQDNDFLENIEKILRASSFGEFLNHGRIGRQYVDGQGARRVVEAILLGLKKMHSKDRTYADI